MSVVIANKVNENSKKAFEYETMITPALKVQDS
jgi:hypothetical protein